jgi:uncharacterized membrane protein
MECFAAAGILAVLIFHVMRTESWRRRFEAEAGKAELLSGTVRDLERRLAVLERERAEPSRVAAQADAPQAGALVPAAPTPVTGESAARIAESTPAMSAAASDSAAEPSSVRTAPIVSQPPARAAPPPVPRVPISDRLPLSASAPPAAPAPSLEERLGGRLPVWIGSVALALAGAFLVKYSFDQGWLSPAVRVALGVAFGVALVAVGEQLQARWPRIAAGLPAAGIADLFACFLAATNLYHLIPPAVGFGLMALTAVAGVILALRHGPIVALIGLLGGFLTPALISTCHPSARNLFGYLLVLLAASLTVARRRAWSAVVAVALLGSLLWVSLWLGAPFAPGDGLWLSLFLLLCGGAAVFWDLDHESEREGGREPRKGAFASSPWLARGTLFVSLLLLLRVDVREEYSSLQWGFLGILGASLLILGRLRAAFAWLPWAAGGLTALLLAAWGADLPASQAPRYLATIALLGVAYALGAFLAHRGAERPDSWAALSAAAALAYFVIAWVMVSGERDLRWSGAALLLAGLYSAATAQELRRRPSATLPPGSRTQGSSAGFRPALPPLASWAVAATSFLSLALPLALAREWWSVAWALEAAALVALRQVVRSRAVAVLAVVVGSGVLVRLLLNPYLFDYAIGEHVLFNWLVYGYGVPILAFAVAAHFAQRDGKGWLATFFDAGWSALAFVFASLEVKQLFHPGRLADPQVEPIELSTLIVVWLVLGIGLISISGRMRRPALAIGGTVILGVAVIAELAGPLAFFNPLFDHHPVGDRWLINGLLWSFGAPALLLAVAARLLRRFAEGIWAAAAWAASLVLAFVTVSLEVRQAFHGTYLDAPATTAAERYAYSAAWLVFGALLLAAGVARKGRALRYASLAVMLLTVCKVFLYDTANLTGLYRVASFLGLGVALMALAWVYQRFVFRSEDQTASRGSNRF